MTKPIFFLAAVLGWTLIQDQRVIPDEKKATVLRDKFLALTDDWARSSVLKRAEMEAMQKGRQWEALMTTGLDDPLARKILAAGEPSFDALAAVYPGKVLDRTVLGSYSDPGAKLRNTENEFAIWWNGAISADLIEGRLRGAIRPVAANTNVVFLVGAGAEMFGKNGDSFSRIGYEDGYLPIVRARYESGGIRYEETAVAENSSGETGGWDVAFVEFQATNISGSRRAAELHEEIVLMDGTRANASGTKILNSSGALLLTHSDSQAKFDESSQRLSHRFDLAPGEKASVYLKIPYLPDSQGTVKPVDAASFETAYQKERGFWTDLLSAGMRIETPEARVNDVWRALLLQNFILADGPRFTYGSGIWYNNSYFPVENGLGGNDFAFYGHESYSHALLPQCMQTSIYPDKAGRKYQNRRGVALHHLYENFRLSRKMDVFQQHKKDFFRVADEIIADRRKTMVEENGKKPRHWGLLPPDRPGADDLGGNYTMYVLAHNITSCQGLQDFANFLIRSGVETEKGKRYLEEARQYRKTILEVMKAGVIHSAGRPPFVPLETLYFKETPDYGPDPYDDLARGRVQGTYYHYWADMELGYNFFNPDDPVARWITDYLEKMGGFVLGCTRARNRPAQPYGWINNVYNSGYYNLMLRRGEIDKFLLGFYSRFAFGMSRHVYAASEGSPFIGYNTKDGGFVGADYSFPNSAANSETLRMLRTALIYEELKDNTETGDIFLARGAPRAWYRDGEKILVSGAPTFFGKLSFTIESRLREKMMTALITPPARDRFESLVVSFRHPQKAPIRRIRVNNQDHRDFDVQREWVRLPRGPKDFVVEVFY